MLFPLLILSLLNCCEDLNSSVTLSLSPFHYYSSITSYHMLRAKRQDRKDRLQTYLPIPITLLSILIFHTSNLIDSIPFSNPSNPPWNKHQDQARPRKTPLFHPYPSINPLRQAKPSQSTPNQTRRDQTSKETNTT